MNNLNLYDNKYKGTDIYKPTTDLYKPVSDVYKGSSDVYADVYKPTGLIFFISVIFAKYNCKVRTQIFLH